MVQSTAHNLRCSPDDDSQRVFILHLLQNFGHILGNRVVAYLNVDIAMQGTMIITTSFFAFLNTIYEC